MACPPGIVLVPLGRRKARYLAARFLTPPVENRACGRVGHQRVALTGTFPMAPLQTSRESFDLKQLASGFCRKFSFEARCGMVSPPTYAAKAERDDGDQLHMGIFRTRHYSAGC